MNRLYPLLILIFIAGAANAQTPAKQAAGPTSAKPAASGYRIKYDHSALRIPGNKFAIGLIVPAAGKKPADTIGYPGKQESWGKYHIEVDSGSFSGGNVKLHASSVYMKGDSVTVSVYTRKWLLGGRGKFLVSRKIPYNYEDSIELLYTGNADRAPGDHLKFGVRTIYDNKQFADLWYPVKKKDKSRFLLGFDGGHLSPKKGDWKISADPTRITGDRVRLFARLAKDSAIGDTLSLMLDYTANYKCAIRSTGNGHELDATVDVLDDTTIHAQLLRVEVRDSSAHRTYHYLLNTKGSSLAISSAGANGADGANGLDGLSGSDGADGAITETPVTTTDANGNTTTTYDESQGPGSNGGDGGPGDNGQDGGNGGNGGNIFIRFTAAAKPFLPLIHATSVPGVGGSGGRGGSGGSGGRGGSGTPPGMDGSKGSDGLNGSDGAPGKAGAVKFLAL